MTLKWVSSSVIVISFLIIMLIIFPVCSPSATSISLTTSASIISPSVIPSL